VSPLAPEHFDETLEGYARRDPELYRELREKISQPSEGFAATAARMSLTEASPVSERGEATERARRVAETIVRPNARPVLTIRDNRRRPSSSAPTVRSGPSASPRRSRFSTG
jgi:hypothetical protein